jgi:putative tricarboxylic transport membrane protein
MKKADQWSGFFLLILSALICWGAYGLPYGKVRDPGPGFLPWWLGLILGMMSLALLLKCSRRNEKAKTLRDLWRGEIQWARILLALLALFLFASLLDTVGFLILSFFFLACLLRFVEPQPWKSVIGWAVAGSVSFYLVFEVWLTLRFPKGPLGF